MLSSHSLHDKNILFQISLIDRVHKIYNDTIWQDRQELDGFKGMGFVIKKIVVHSEPTNTRGSEIHYNMIRDKWDVRNLLEVSITNIDFSTNFPVVMVWLLTFGGRFSVVNIAIKISVWHIYLLI